MKCLILIIVLTTYNCCYSKQLPSYIEKCNKREDLNKCLIERAMELIPKLVKGIPELKLPAIEPLRVPKMEIHGEGFNVIFKDLSVFGGGQLQIKDFNFDLKKKHIFLNLFIPKLKIQGPYEFDGKVLLLEFRSQGISHINITDVETKTHMNISLVEKNKKHYIDLGDDFKITRKSGKISLYFEDLFKGNPQLTETTNSAINTNIKEIGKEISPILNESVHTLIVGLIKPFFNEFAIEDLFV